MACTVYRGSRFISSILQRSQVARTTEIAPKLLTSATHLITNQPNRNSSFRSSPAVRDLNEYPEVEIIRNPPEWKFVERLLPPATVPQAPKDGENFASGWKPQREFDPKTDRYFVRRTKNHMIPVYLLKLYRGTRRVTLIRHVQGDIWAMEKDLRRVVEKSQNGRLCASRVNELSGQITFHGDYVDLLIDYLREKGY